MKLCFRELMQAAAAVVTRAARIKSLAGTTSLVSITLALLLITAAAQTADSQSSAASTQPPAAAVLLNVLVTDQQNQPTKTLRPEDLRVTEDGAPQSITFFSSDEVPLSYGLVIDNSGSLRTQFGVMLEASKRIINSNKNSDETFLTRFVGTDRIERVQDLTSDTDKLLAGLGKLYVEEGRTALTDAVYSSTTYLAQSRQNSLTQLRRRALILITDGEDINSQYKFDMLLARLRESDVQIFPIGLVREIENTKRAIGKSPRERATNLLEQLARETGGRAFFPNSTDELRQVADQITTYLRTQYVVGYTPPRRRNKPYRKVRVTLINPVNRQNYTLTTRPGYTISIP